VNKKIDRFRRKRDREALSSVGREPRKKSSKTGDLNSISDDASSIDESNQYQDLESRSRETTIEEVGHDIRTSEAYRR
jgi:hypothetical protein